ncbi:MULTISPECIES: hypothetical protein [Devosia]|uniref:Uncharacterized protein n=1 Tax=Devosia sediminis TaxID=2798801 RepID=A0A934MM66_9HYPH|nr:MULTISPECIES: hypothetical protein [Devosia]MBJ3786993.1 hypothetical protein [Devosia sediminis]
MADPFQCPKPTGQEITSSDEATLAVITMCSGNHFAVKGRRTSWIKRAWLDRANSNEEMMDGITSPVVSIPSQSEIVLAVWQDKAAESDVSTLLKGQKRRAASMGSRHQN